MKNSSPILLLMQRIRRWAAIFVNLEAAFLLSLALYLFIRTATSDVTELDAMIAEITLLIVGAIGLFFAGRGVLRERRYGRGPIVLANLIALGVAYYMIDGGRLLWGLALGAVALAAGGLAIAAIPQNARE
jgi:hypothetical protein